MGLVLGVINLIVIIIFFSDIKLEKREAKKKVENEAEKKNNKKLNMAKDNRIFGYAKSSAKKHYDMFGAAALVIIFFVILFGFCAFEV